MYVVSLRFKKTYGARPSPSKAHVFPAVIPSLIKKGRAIIPKDTMKSHSFAASNDRSRSSALCSLSKINTENGQELVSVEQQMGFTEIEDFYGALSGEIPNLINATIGNPAKAPSSAVLNKMSDLMARESTQVYGPASGPLHARKDIADACNKKVAQALDIKEACLQNPYQVEGVHITAGGTQAAMAWITAIKTLYPEELTFILTAPTYPIYALQLGLFNLSQDDIETVPINKEGLTDLNYLESLCLKLREKSQHMAFIFANPGNPCGVASQEYLAALAKIIESYEVDLLIDHAYFYCLPEKDRHRPEVYFKSTEKLAIAGSISKSPGLPKYRSGALITRSDSLNQVLPNVLTSLTLDSSITASVGVQALMTLSDDELNETSDFYESRMQYLHTACQQMELVSEQARPHPFFIFTSTFDKLINKGLLLPACVKQILERQGFRPGNTVENAAGLVAHFAYHTHIVPLPITVQTDQGSSKVGLRLLGAHADLDTIDRIIAGLHHYVSAFSDQLEIDASQLPSLEQIMANKPCPACANGINNVRISAEGVQVDLLEPERISEELRQRHTQALIDYLSLQIDKSSKKPAVIISHPFTAGCEGLIAALQAKGCTVYNAPLADRVEQNYHGLLPAEQISQIAQDQHIIMFGQPTYVDTLFAAHYEDSLERLEQAYQQANISIVGTHVSLLTAAQVSLHADAAALISVLSASKQENSIIHEPPENVHQISLQQAIAQIQASNTLEEAIGATCLGGDVLFDIGDSCFYLLAQLHKIGQLHRLSADQINLLVKSAIGDASSYAAASKEHLIVFSGDTAIVNAGGVHQINYANKGATVIFANATQAIEDRIAGQGVEGHYIGVQIPQGPNILHASNLEALKSALCQCLEHQAAVKKGQDLPALIVEVDLYSESSTLSTLSKPTFAFKKDTVLLQKLDALNQTLIRCFGYEVPFIGCSAFEWVAEVSSTLKRYEAQMTDQQAVLTAIERVKQKASFSHDKARQAVGLVLNSMFPNRLSDGLQDVFGLPHNNVLVLLVRDTPKQVASLFKLGQPHSPWMRKRADSIGNLCRLQVRHEGQLYEISTYSDTFVQEIEAAAGDDRTRVILIKT